MKVAIRSMLMLGVFSLLVLQPEQQNGQRMFPGCAAFSTSSASTARQSLGSDWNLFVKNEIDTSHADSIKNTPPSTAAQHDKKMSKRKPNRSNQKKRGPDSAMEKKKILNGRLVQSESASELFQALQQSTGALTKVASGGVLSTVNLSTALHRLARHSLQPKARTPILADPRLALLLAAVAEALVDTTQYRFTARELSNISWALAKLRIAPPSKVMPLTTHSSSNDMQSIAKDLRIQIMNVSKAKQSGQTVVKPVWVPTMSKLAGMILDEVSGQFDRASSTSIKQQEFSNVLWAWATANRVDPQVFGRLIRRMMAHDVEESKPQEWSNACWAFATAKVYDGYEEMIVHIAKLMQEESFVKQFKPQEMANMIWGLATLLSNLSGEMSLDIQKDVLHIVRTFVPHILSMIHNFKTQELSNVLWGMATLGFGSTQSTDNTKTYYLVLDSESPALDQKLKNASIQAICKAASAKLHQFKSQELNNVAWSLARLVDEESVDITPLLRGLGEELCKPRRRVQSLDLSMSLWGFATLDFSDDQLYRRVLSRFTPAMVRAASTQELSNSLWAVATAEIDVGSERDAFDTTFLLPEDRPVPDDPIVSFFGDAAVELMERPSQFNPQEIKDCLWSFSRVSIRHPELFKRTAEHLVGEEDGDFASARGLDDFSGQGLANMAWAYARQAQLSEEISDRHESSLTTLKSGKLAIRTASFFDMGEKLLHRLFREIAEADLRVQRDLTECRPQDISNTAWAMGVLAIRHDKFLLASKKEFEKRTRLFLSGDGNSMNYFKGQEVSNLLWAMATLNIPADGMLVTVGEYLRRISQDDRGTTLIQRIATLFNRLELANIAWSCAVFGEYPLDLMKFLYLGLVGDGKDPDALSDLYGDGGLQSQAVMTLIYVQTSMDLSSSTSGLALPDNFPDGWSSHFSRDGVDTELSLTISKMQRQVSDALKRVGFDHVQEHTISMKQLANEYSISLAPKPNEILSIDIADIQARIAIEVDGPSHFVTSVENEGGSAGFTRRGRNGSLDYQFTWTGDHQMLNGSTAMKQRLLRALGWTAISIPFWDFDNLPSPSEQEETYCRRLLDHVATSQGKESVQYLQ